MGYPTGKPPARQENADPWVKRNMPEIRVIGWIIVLTSCCLWAWVTLTGIETPTNNQQPPERPIQTDNGSNSNNFRDLPQPARSGVLDITNSEVVIQNASPSSLTITFAGVTQRTVRLAACSSCQVYQFAGPRSCPSGGSTGRYALSPGRYTVTVSANDGGYVQNYRGTWQLESSFEYTNCFFIVQR